MASSANSKYPQYWLPMPILFQQLTSIPNFPQYWIPVPTLVPRKERERKEAEIASAEFIEGERKKLVALFKTFRGTASRCKQTINHAVPRIKQPNSLLYDILLHCKNRSRIHPKIWLQVPIPNTHNIGFPCQFYSNNRLPVSVFRISTILDSCSNSSATERKGEKGGRNCVGRIYGGRKKLV
ncbi:hypothetical protein Lal_00005009 [Lupinus albus]|nr:hypothetical protein Lal_00005009 [Lupinus albus]